MYTRIKVPHIVSKMSIGDAGRAEGIFEQSLEISGFVDYIRRSTYSRFFFFFSLIMVSETPALNCCQRRIGATQAS